jgi:hypothetical protein
VVAFIVEKSSLEELLEEYDSCVKIEEDNFFDLCSSRFTRSLEKKLKEAEEDDLFNKYGSRFKREETGNDYIDTLEKKKEIITKLFSDYDHAQLYWLEAVLHILRRENNKDLLRTIIRNLAGSTYGVFKTIYTTLVIKESDLVNKQSNLVNKKSDRDLLSKDVQELQKLRKSMIMHLDESDLVEYQKKLSCCMESEPCLDLYLVLLLRIEESLYKYDLIIRSSSWMKTESISSSYEAYGLSEISELKITADMVLKIRDTVNKKSKAACMNRNATPELQN